MGAVGCRGIGEERKLKITAEEASEAGLPGRKFRLGIAPAGQLESFLGVFVFSR